LVTKQDPTGKNPAEVVTWEFVDKISSKRMLFSVISAAEALSWNSRQIWQLIKNHKDAVKKHECNNMKCESTCGFGLASVRVGTRVFITRESLEGFISIIQEKSFESLSEFKKEDSSDTSS
jgi:hypothetical protein